LVEYVHRLDTEGLKVEGDRRKGEIFFSDLFAGMLLTERDSVKQVEKGVFLFRDFVNMYFDEGLAADPFIAVPREKMIEEMERWAAAKAENNRQLAETLGRASWAETRQGRRLAWLESNFFGAPGALYAHGAEIAVVFKPQFGNPPVRKFTVAGNSVVVAPVLERLKALESGWGGPATGTILGSPREGSVLTLEQVVAVVTETL
jgi:hypothetical protein